jgi:6,7-dimethyl-8-ribityllumazine synthase
MASHGAPTIRPEGAGARVAIVASLWHTQVMDGLIAGAQAALAEANVNDVTLVRAPGSFELPVVCQAYARQGYDAVIALGVIIRGGHPTLRVRLGRRDRWSEPGRPRHGGAHRFRPADHR